MKRQERNERSRPQGGEIWGGGKNWIFERKETACAVRCTQRCDVCSASSVFSQQNRTASENNQSIIRNSSLLSSRCWHPLILAVLLAACAPVGGNSKLALTTPVKPPEQLSEGWHDGLRVRGGSDLAREGGGQGGTGGGRKVENDIQPRKSRVPAEAVLQTVTAQAEDGRGCDEVRNRATCVVCHVRY